MNPSVAPAWNPLYWSFVLLALGAGLFLEADPFWLTGAASAFILGTFTPPRLAVLLLLVAPALLAAGAPQDAIVTLRGIAWFPVALLAVVPFYLRLGGRVPLRGAWVFLLVAFALPSIALLHPAVATLLASDLAPRLQVLLVATATLVALLVSTLLLARTRKAPTVQIDLQDHDGPRRLYR